MTDPAQIIEVTPALRRALTVGLVLAEALGAIEMVVVAAIMPAVVADIGGLEFYAWTFSAYMLATVVSIPIAGRSADRSGAARAFAIGMTAYTAGLVAAAVSPTMLWLTSARALQGIGAGAIYAIAMGTIAKAYPESKRARVLALLSFAWIVPGMVGPALGAFIATHFGWRWAFIAPIPLVPAVVALALPALRRLRPGDAIPETLSPLYPVLLGAGSALFIAGLNAKWWIAVVTSVAGIAVAYLALRKILPAGSLAARAGLPAAVAAAFMLEFGLFGADSFVPLMLTEVRGRSLTEAGVAVTAVSVGWAAGSWAQARITDRYSHRSLATAGSLLVAICIALTASAMAGAPLALVYISWGVGGVGMGITFSTIMLVAMEQAQPGAEATATSAAGLSGTLGGAIGPGLGGAGVTIALTLDSTISYGLAWAFGISIAASIAVALIAKRLPTVRGNSNDQAAEGDDLSAGRRTADVSACD